MAASLFLVVVVVVVVEDDEDDNNNDDEDEDDGDDNDNDHDDHGQEEVLREAVVSLASVLRHAEELLTPSRLLVKQGPLEKVVC